MHPDVHSLSVFLLDVSPMYTLPQLHEILYTTEELVSVDNLSFTLEICDLRVFPDLKSVMMLYSLHTNLISSLKPYI